MSSDEEEAREDETATEETEEEVRRRARDATRDARRRATTRRRRATTARARTAIGVEVEDARGRARRRANGGNDAREGRRRAARDRTRD